MSPHQLDGRCGPCGRHFTSIEIGSLAQALESIGKHTCDCGASLDPMTFEVRTITLPLVGA